MEEVWKSIPEHTTYLVSNLGNLKRSTFKRINTNGHEVTYKEKRLKPTPVKHYYRLDFWKDGKKDGYVYVHHIVYKLFIGDIKEGYVVDHINGNPLDNRECNLRCVNRSQNCWNVKNVKGYSFNKKWKLYFSYITENGKIHRLGYYRTKEEARMAYVRGVLKYHGGYHEAKLTEEEIKEALAS